MLESEREANIQQLHQQKIEAYHKRIKKLPMTTKMLHMDTVFLTKNREKRSKR
jgi:hypothetical protein